MWVWPLLGPAVVDGQEHFGAVDFRGIMDTYPCSSRMCYLDSNFSKRQPSSYKLFVISLCRSLFSCVDIYSSVLSPDRENGRLLLLYRREILLFNVDSKVVGKTLYSYSDEELRRHAEVPYESCRYGFVCL